MEVGVRSRIRRVSGDVEGAREDVRRALDLAERHALSPLIEECRRELASRFVAI